MSVTWRDHFATGIEAIDDQHRELFARLDRFLGAIDEGNGTRELLPTLDFLGQYAASHFTVEENLMDAHAYPHVGLQITEHLRFMDDLEKLRIEVKTGSATHELALRTGRSFTQWLIHHICELDREFGEFLRGRTARSIRIDGEP
jgi:hemerythrin